MPSKTSVCRAASLLSSKGEREEASSGALYQNQTKTDSPTNTALQIAVGKVVFLPALRTIKTHVSVLLLMPYEQGQCWVPPGSSQALQVTPRRGTGVRVGDRDPADRAVTTAHTPSTRIPTCSL